MADMKTLLLSKPMKGYELTAQLFRDISALGLASCQLFDRRRRQPPTTHPTLLAARTKFISRQSRGLVHSRSMGRTQDRLVLRQMSDDV